MSGKVKCRQYGTVIATGPNPQCVCGNRCLIFEREGVLRTESTSLSVPTRPPSMSTDDKLDAIMQKLIGIDISITKLESTLTATFKDEFDEGRHEVSKRLGDKIKLRLKGEFLAREKTAPSGAYWCPKCDQPHPGDFKCQRAI